jgi:hypothetical protein
MQEIELSGIDGTNLLGYLAALGTLRVLTLAEPAAEVRMRWQDNGGWRPLICHSRISTVEKLIAALALRVTPRGAIPARKPGTKKGSDPSWRDWEARGLENANRTFQSDYLYLTPTVFRKELEDSALRPEQREIADFMTALGSDCLAEVMDVDKPATTEFRAIGGGNNDGFLGFMRTIHLGTTAEHLRKALFLEWEYSDPPPFMRWDHNEYRPHALRADNPALDKRHNNVRGANRLAVEALPLFPTAPSKRVLRTVGFEDRSGDPEVAWPIWLDNLDVNALKSLLACSEIQVADPTTMARRGIGQVFRARRFTRGQYRNFSPARAML